ncbi:pancreatic triacylglycerol lipase-like [Haliotis cracherodii]|uniref:pancreatic triacylglycerol lipase-like n=1 Tax=Haliotis cracherodii TaxID=6455 RepID=UPI0039E782C5
MLHVLVLWGLFAVATPTAAETHKRSNVCYDGLGCFDTAPPFFSLYRPLNFLPQSPLHIHVQFLLYTKLNPVKAQYLSAGSAKSVSSSHFDPRKPTKMITHGFIDTGKEPWLHTMKDEFLKNNDYNVIIIDWGGGSAPPYTQATANTRIVGAVIAQLITYLKTKAGAKPEDFHILGHSLGAHVAGYAGERIQYVGRITGLDPADPYFQNTDIKVRLDPTDALFVDIIHTDGESILKLGYGMRQACGHVDYFPNGGMTQPGCDKGPITQINIGGVAEGVKQFVACNHLRSYALFTESINSKCPFEGFKCNSYDDFNNGRCMPCSGKGCGSMGFHADRVKPSGHQTLVKYFLQTGGDGPFCRFHYQVKLSFGKPAAARTETGNLFVTLIGTGGQSGEIQLTSGDIDVIPGRTFSFIVTSQTNLGDISRITFRWSHSSHWYKPLDWNPLGLRKPYVFLDGAVIASGEEAKSIHICGHNMPVPNNSPKQLSQLC